MALIRQFSELGQGAETKRTLHSGSPLMWVATENVPFTDEGANVFYWSLAKEKLISVMALTNSNVFQ